jgi:hypothetical protein
VKAVHVTAMRGGPHEPVQEQFTVSDGTDLGGLAVVPVAGLPRRQNLIRSIAITAVVTRFVNITPGRPRSMMSCIGSPRTQ